LWTKYAVLHIAWYFHAVHDVHGVITGEKHVYVF